MKTLASFLLCVMAISCSDLAGPHTGRLGRDAKQRGVAYAHTLRGDQGYGSEASKKSLEDIRQLGADWVSITPFGFQRSSTETAIVWTGRGGKGIDETDERIAAAIRSAHDAGLRVLLKPHVWLRPPDWPGSIEPATPEGWAAWFDSYEEFILHYATIARDTRADALCIGNELEKSTTHEAEWRGIIASIRTIYPGPLTYGANFTEYKSVKFWDALDWIGISAYFPLSTSSAPSVAELRSGWKPHVAEMQALSERCDRKILFTEIGYRSARGAAGRQWEIAREAVASDEEQAAAYQAFFEEVWGQPWLEGAYLWKWESGGHSDDQRTSDYTYEGKPAERIIRSAFHESGQRRTALR